MILRVRMLTFATSFFAISLALLLGANPVQGDERLAGKACRSVHLRYSAPEGVAFYNELTVEKSAEGTYFMSCGFNMGYFGIQEKRGGKKVVIFSVWEPGKQNNPNATPEERRVKALAEGEGVLVRRFGGEGTGGQSFLNYDWKNGERCRFLVTAQPDGERTAYSGYFYLPQEKKWQLMATFSTLAKGKLLRGYYSFVEDFRRNRISATQARKSLFGNGWVQATDGKWHALTKARFTGDRNPATNINSGVQEGEFFLATGGETKNSDTPLGQASEVLLAQRPDYGQQAPNDLPDPSDAATSASLSRLRVLSYNIKHGLGMDGKLDLQRAAKVINQIKPDLVALQEVDNKVSRSGSVNQPEELAKLTGMHATFGSFLDYGGGEYGMAILSKFPIRSIKNLRLPNGAEPRTSLIIAVKPQAEGPELLFANVHFYRSEAERLAQAKTLLEYLDKQGKPAIVAGDFNSKPNSSVLQLFADEWTVPSKGEDCFTFSSKRPTTEIDYLMFRPTTLFKVEQIDVLDRPVVSDHRPVLLDLMP